MATLAERFTPQPAALQEAQASIRQDTAPVGQPEPAGVYATPSGPLQV